MAITISQQPTSPNMANADLLFTVDSTQKTQPQFQYVCDIYESGSTYDSSSANFIQRIKQQPNPAGYGVFNVGQILVQFTGDDQPWKTQQFATSTITQKDYVVRFGEQYGTSVSSSITTYNGINTNPSENPNKTGSLSYSVTNGLLDPYQAVNWNFPSASYVAMESASYYSTFSHQNALTNAPTTQKIQDGEYATVSLYNGNFDGSTADAQDIAYVSINVFNAAGTNIQNYQYENEDTNGGGPRTNMSELWSSVAADQDQSTKLIHVGVGPQNIDDNGTALNANWSYYTVKFVGQGDDNLENSDGVYAQFTFQKDEANCEYPGVRFAWKNEFGVWDYYTFKLQSDASSAIERQSYEQTFVNYSNNSATVSYDQSRRGTTQFYNDVKQNKTANTDWLNQDHADWLRELFYSSNVYIQEGTEFRPVVITSANLTEKTNPRTQKTFQYTIEFQPANQLRPRQ